MECSQQLPSSALQCSLEFNVFSRRSYSSPRLLPFWESLAPLGQSLKMKNCLWFHVKYIKDTHHGAHKGHRESPPVALTLQSGALCSSPLWCFRLPEPGSCQAAVDSAPLFCLWFYCGWNSGRCSLSTSSLNRTNTHCSVVRAGGQNSSIGCSFHTSTWIPQTRGHLEYII